MRLNAFKVGRIREPGFPVASEIKCLRYLSFWHLGFKLEVKGKVGTSFTEEMFLWNLSYKSKLELGLSNVFCLIL